MKKEPHKSIEEETAKKFHDFIFNEKGYIPVKEALERAKEKYPEKG